MPVLPFVRIARLFNILKMTARQYFTLLFLRERLSTLGTPRSRRAIEIINNIVNIQNF